MYVIQYRDKYDHNPDNWKSWSSAHLLKDAEAEFDRMSKVQADSKWRIWDFETRKTVKSQ